jgi:hypothetical protein
MRRIAVALLFLAVVLPFQSGEASAAVANRGFVSVRATVTGPSLVHPVVFRGPDGHL